MQISLKRYWTRFQSQAERKKPADPLAAAALIGGAESLYEIVDQIAVPGQFHVAIRLSKASVLLLEPKILASLLLALGIYTAAAFLANEWLYLLSCGLVVVTIAGFVLPSLTVLSLMADCRMPQSALANDASEIVVSVKRRRFLRFLGWLLPIDCLRTRALLARRSVAGYVAEQTLSRQPVLLENIAQQATLKLQIPLLERGVYKLSSLEVSTASPFGMVCAMRRLKPQSGIEDKIVVFPRSCSLNGAFLIELRGQLSSMGLSFTETLALTQSTSVRSIRDFREGDSLRHIHWPSSARMGKMLVREFDSETLPVFDIFLDLQARWLNRNQFELAIYVVTSLINFGSEHDIIPTLYLNPPLDSEELEGLLCDLPKAQPPLDLLIEILARVEPLPSRSSTMTLSSSATRELLSIIPCKDTLLKTSNAHGNEVIAPVQLIARHGQTDAAQQSNLVIATIHGDEDLRTL